MYLSASAPGAAERGTERVRGTLPRQKVPRLFAKKEVKNVPKDQVLQAQNGNLEQFQNSQKKLLKSYKQTRYFSGVTYATESQLKKVFHEHISSLRAFCYIIHDKDDSEPHTHFIIRTHSTWYPKQIERWFSDLKDKKKQPVNTFCEPANDLTALKQYLTHSDHDSKEKGKYQYSESDIKDFGMSDIIPKGNSFDSSYEVINDILSGVSFRKLIIKYGRDFVYHWQSYCELAQEIRNQEGYAEAKMMAQVAMTGKTSVKPSTMEQINIDQKFEI